MHKYLPDEHNPPHFVNNYDWFKNVGYIEFLRDIGKHFSVNAMMAKESVRLRLNTREQGISYTEFSYALLQSYDFYQLHKNYDCRLQVGGSDQWGNITSGVDIIRRINHTQVYGMTFPLLTNSGGQKFGKTEAGNIWLTKDKTSVYDFYQFFLRLNDAEALTLLPKLTNIDEISYRELTLSTEKAPEMRKAQLFLAEELVKTVHSQEDLEEAQKTSATFFQHKDIPTLSQLNPTDLKKKYSEVPATKFAHGDLPISIVELLVLTKLCSSRRQAKHDLQSGGIYVNDVRVEDLSMRIEQTQLLAGTYLLLRKGKKNYHLCDFTKAELSS